MSRVRRCTGQSVKLVIVAAPLWACSGKLVEDSPAELAESDREDTGHQDRRAQSPTPRGLDSPAADEVVGVAKQDARAIHLGLGGSGGDSHQDWSCAESCRAHFSGETGLTERHPGYVEQGVLVLCGGPETKSSDYIEPCVEVCNAQRSEAAEAGCLPELGSLWRFTFPNDECIDDSPVRSQALAECLAEPHD